LALDAEEFRGLLASDQIFEIQHEAVAASLSTVSLSQGHTFTLLASTKRFNQTKALQNECISLLNSDNLLLPGRLDDTAARRAVLNAAALLFGIRVDDRPPRLPGLRSANTIAK